MVSPRPHRLPRLACIAFVGISLVSASEKDPLSAGVDAIFARWDKPDSPGCVCAVIREGKLVHVRGYGMADMEHAESLSANSVFYIASTSKQFTAASIALLVLDGKLSLDDDIRQHVPEMPERSPPITVRHLVHHTSGLPDYFALLSFTGWTDADYFNNDMVVRLLASQRTLAFEPGARHAYSNSNYVLLAEIVKRVSGHSLRQFADERIFQPLGMKHTHFDDDYHQIVPHRVISYAPKPGGGWNQLLKEFDGYGDGNLLTTVEDLARWDENFTTGQVGGRPFLDLILTRGKLSTGKDLDYAFGLGHGKYRGLETVSHAGAFKGFRTQMIRFPQQKFTVIVLSNAANFDGRDVNKVADLYLESQFAEPRPAAPSTGASAIKREPVKIDSKRFDDYAGNYELNRAPGFVISFTREGDRYFAQATGQSRAEIFPSSENTFFYTIVDAQLTFHRESDGSVRRMTLHQGGNQEATRVVSTTLPASELAAYTGSYTSYELDTTYRLELEKGQLVSMHSRMGTLPLAARARDHFTAAGTRIEFVRDAGSNITGMTLSGRGVENLVFERQDRRN